MRESVRHTLHMHRHTFSLTSLARAVSPTVLGTVVGCAVDLTPPPDATATHPGPVVTVSATQLSWTSDSTVRYSITNPDGAAVYWRCPLEGLQYYRNGWRRTAWRTDGGCIDDWPPFSSLARGDSIVARYRLTNDLIPQAGWYRFIFALYRAPNDAYLWDEANRVSPSFYVGP